MAAHSSINVLSVIFPGSNEASFSLASFITLVRREWSDRDGSLPNKSYGLTQVVRAIVAWVALQGVTQEWQENRWFQYLNELDVMDKEKTEREKPVVTRQRRYGPSFSLAITLLNSTLGTRESASLPT